MDLPFQRRPSDEELVKYYLRQKILGLPLSAAESKLVIEVDMYGNARENASSTLISSRDLFCSDADQLPWQPLDSTYSRFVSSALYLFTRLPIQEEVDVAGGGAPLSRVVPGFGTWHENPNKEKRDVYDWDTSSVIGYKRLFMFKPSSGQPKEAVLPGISAMVEYHIHPEAFGMTTTAATHVLCVILRHVRITNGEVADYGCQRNNLFYTRCLVQNNLGLLLIDGGASRNIASAWMK